PGANRALDTTRQRAHRAPASAPEGPLFAARTAEARRPPATAPAVPAKARPRGVSRTDPTARPQEINDLIGARLRPGSVATRQETEGGSLSDRARNTWPALTQTSTFKKEVEEQMSIATQGPTTLSVEIAGREITFETGKLAKQADGAVVVREGETVVLATAQGKTEAREGADFFPLTVDVEERMYAAGKIPGGFFKREGRPTERAILTARMIDRPIRPLWPKGFKNEVHVVATTLSADLVNAHDILAINGASAALMISPLPFLGPVGAVRMGLIDGELVVNPTLAEVEQGESTLDLVVVGTKDALTMVEAGAGEIPEELLLQALERAHDEIRKLCDLQEDLARQVGKAKRLDPELTGDLGREHGDTIRQRIALEGLREGATAVEDIVEQISPPVTMESTEDEIIRRMQVRASLALLLERLRQEAVEAPVREQFEGDLRGLTDAEQDP